jgi:hypothetical protein
MTRCRSSSLTGLVLFSTCETVVTETPADAATSDILTMRTGPSAHDATQR